jgi:hypothetical protein
VMLAVDLPLRMIPTLYRNSVGPGCLGFGLELKFGDKISISPMNKEKCFLMTQSLSPLVCHCSCSVGLRLSVRKSVTALLKSLHRTLAEQLLGAFDEASVGAYG